MSISERFIFSPDKHVGYERVMGRKRPLHNQGAIDAMLAFAQDFKPTTWIEGGDNLDCGVISHHNAKKKLSLEGLRLEEDIAEYDAAVMEEVEKLNPRTRIWMSGNHETWLHDLMEEQPGLADGVLDVRKRLELADRGWSYLPEGAHYKIGRLYFTHGSSVSGGANPARNAVIDHERNIRFGHFHTYQVYTKHTPVDARESKTGMAVPCLCHKGPGYGKRRPNKWVTGFNFGYVHDDGTFTDYCAVIINNKFTWNGKTYRG